MIEMRRKATANLPEGAVSSPARNKSRLQWRGTPYRRALLDALKAPVRQK